MQTPPQLGRPSPGSAASSAERDARRDRLHADARVRIQNLEGGKGAETDALQRVVADLREGLDAVVSNWTSS